MRKKKRRGLSGDTRRAGLSCGKPSITACLRVVHIIHASVYLRPEDDARGLCSEVPTAIYVPEEIKQEGRWQPRVTDEEKQQLVKMYQAGMPIRAISRETGRAYETITNVLEELGCRKKKPHKSVHWTYEEFQKAVAMRKRGYLFKEIGAALGKSNHAVQNKFAREGY